MTPSEQNPQDTPVAPSSTAADGAAWKRGIFRAQAVEQADEGHRQGDILRISPRWVDATFHVFIWGVVASIVFGLVVTTKEYATGPAVVRYASMQDAINQRSGTVKSV